MLPFNSTDTCKLINCSIDIILELLIRYSWLCNDSGKPVFGKLCADGLVVVIGHKTSLSNNAAVMYL